MLPHLSILVPAKNEEKTIGKCLDSLLNSDYPEDKLEILVNVNGSRDNTYEIVKKYKKVKTIKTPAKSCRAEALNELIPMAKGEIIGIFDADTFVEKDCLKQAVNRFSDQTVMGVGGLVKSVKKGIISKSLSIEKLNNSLIEYIISYELGYNSHFVGKNMFIRKRIFEEIGHLNSNVWLDDIEISQRMKKYKHKVVFEPKAVTWENEPETLKDFFNQRKIWSKSAFKLKKVGIRTRKEWASDLIHYAGYYFAPLVTLLLSALFVLYFLNYPIQTLAILTSVVFLSGLSFMLFSRIVYNEPFSDLMYLPVMFLLHNVHVVLIVVAFVNEQIEKIFKRQN